ncbi:hypothetical protein GCM10018966_103490 [Streptomyces yanii]
MRGPGRTRPGNLRRSGECELGLQPADFEAGTLHADHEITPYGGDEEHTAVAGPELRAGHRRSSGRRYFSYTVVRVSGRCIVSRKEKSTTRTDTSASPIR